MYVPFRPRSYFSFCRAFSAQDFQFRGGVIVGAVVVMVRENDRESMTRVLAGEQRALISDDLTTD